MPKVEIDGRQVEVEEGLNVIQAAERLGIEIPHYCYHPGLSIAGNCRMCLVEIDKVPKLQIACNTRVSEGLVVRTQTERVRRARQAVLEFLLVNHPIDCPVCDQAGECKLQDYYMDYDLEPSRVPLEEKVHKGKALDIGPLVMLDQERCILCTRCVRFCDEVTKTGELGLFERGDHVTIDLFPGRRLDNPYSGNVVDICPVGALTSKDFRFRARVWYLQRTPSVCPTCATGCNIDIHHLRGRIYRFRPRYNPDVNTWWMCDEGRLGYRAYQGEQRILEPFRRDAESVLRCDWETVLAEVPRLLREGAEAVVFARATNEEAYLLREIFGKLLGGGNLHGVSWSPENASRDDFLRDADKNPNTRGLAALGVLVPVEALRRALLEGRRDVLFVFGGDLEPVLGPEGLRELRRKTRVLVAADFRGHATLAQADWALPVASFAETDGTFTNRGGRVQRIREAFPPPGNARPGWWVLARIAERLGSPKRFATAEEVFAELAAAEPAFSGMSYATVGERGCPLAAVDR
ncbi:MAG: (2Fe-2S)-binding protein [Candidatus Binatia bacterium]|nr:MAG: (2Fe-2S)-binding protein [Candidatus Binatia bacterium]